MGQRFLGEQNRAVQALESLSIVELPCLDSIPNLSAAMAAKMFADLGAETIKVEPPQTGSAERQRAPFKGDVPNRESAGLHLYLNTNKFGITLDLRSDRGREFLARLLDSADVVLNPNPPSLNQQLGLEPSALTARFPKLIVVSLTAFGERTGYRNYRGCDLIATHMSGVGYDTPINQVTDPRNQPPLKPADRQADYLAGMTGAAAAMCALFQRKRTGRGQHVDASLWLSMVSMMRPAIGIYSHELPTAPYGVRVRTRAKLGVAWVYPCADGWVSFSALYDRFWRGTKAAMGNPEWMENEMFSTLQLRATNYDAIEAALIDWLSTRNKDEVFRKVQAEHVPCFPVHTPREVAENEHYRARRFFVEYEHPVAGRVTVPGTPCILGLTPARIRRGAPLLGQHNDEILGRRLGLDAAEMDKLRREAVI